MIPRISARELFDASAPGHAAAVEALRVAVHETGFMTLCDTRITPARVEEVIAAYRAFFAQPPGAKQAVDMAGTASNRGWGAPLSEQVDPAANPDYKEVFDSGYELPPGDPWASRNLSVYAPNRWPEPPEGFRATIEGYYAEASALALRLLGAIAGVLGRPADWFDDKFARPMALLRGNYYPSRPDWAGEKDFGIGAHTDYGCLTLLATDGQPGLEVLAADGTWVPVEAEPGTFVINFGEMLEIWSGGAVRATLHRVRGGREERISVPLFFNPGYDTDVAPPGAAAPVSAGEHLSRRFNETYVHLKGAATPA